MLKVVPCCIEEIVMTSKWKKLFRWTLLLFIALLLGVLLVAHSKPNHYDIHDKTHDYNSTVQQPDLSAQSAAFDALPSILTSVWQKSKRGQSGKTPAPSTIERGRHTEESVELLNAIYPLRDHNLVRVDNTAVSDVLVSGLVVPNVHYMWCGNGWFQFKNYLSVISVLRVIKPDRIVLHHEHPPSIDRVFYHQWLDELKRDYPWLLLQLMDDKLKEFCSSSSRDVQLSIILSVLNETGGIFVGENTWILNFPPKRRMIDFDMSLDANTFDGYVIIRKGVLKSNVTYRDVLKSASYRSRRSTCSHVHHVMSDETIGRTSACIVVTGDAYSQLYPMDIWELDNAFGRLSRRLYYGSEQIRRPVPTYDELVPNIAHMVWIGGGRMDYVFYLSVLSLLYVARVEMVYIHGDVEPAGEYWQQVKIQVQTRDRVRFILRQEPTHVFQGVIEPWYRALMSDLIRVDLMLKYGGIYTDTDAIWVKPLSDADRGYDAVASYDWVDWSWPFPDSVNFGISYGKRNAPFWRLFLDSMRILHNDVHGFTGVMMPYKLLERHPELLRIDRRLQVICYHSRCHPTYVPDYHNVSKDHTNMNYFSKDNWRDEVHTFHWTHPNPPELANRTILMRSSGIFAELGKYVLEQAGLL